MKLIQTTILATFFAGIVSSTAKDLISLAAASDTAREDYVEMTYTSGETEQKIHVSKDPIVTTKNVAKVSIGDDPLLVVVDLTPEVREPNDSEDTGDLPGFRKITITAGLRLRQQQAEILLRATGF